LFVAREGVALPLIDFKDFDFYYLTFIAPMFYI